MKISIRLYVLALAIYTGYRTFDFISGQLPSGLERSFGWFLALIFLFATEIGMFLWHEVSMNHCTTDEQRQVSTALTGIDFIGSLGAGIADMILRQTLIKGYEISPIFAEVLLYGLPITLAINIGAGLYWQAMDKEKRQSAALQSVSFEITKKVTDQLRKNKSAIAGQVYERVYGTFQNQIIQQVEQEYQLGKEKPPAEIKVIEASNLDSAKVLPKELPRNGHEKVILPNFTKDR